MYTVIGREFSTGECEGWIRDSISQFNKNNPRKKINMAPWEVTEVSKDLQALNHALIVGNGVFAKCLKEPRGNLDTGKHYFSINYIENNQIVKVWLYDFIRVVYGDIQDRLRYVDKYVFSSSAIGMSRLLDATDGLFTWLKRHCGTYCQVREG